MAIAQIPRNALHKITTIKRKTGGRSLQGSLPVLLFHAILRMEQLKHECGVAMIRLRNPIEYYRRKYGSYSYALNKLYLLMEKQHNRGQEGAGVGVVKMHAEPGHEYVFRERALGTNAITEIFSNILPQFEQDHTDDLAADEVERHSPFIGEIFNDG